MKLTDYFGDRGFWRDTVRLALPIAVQNMLASSFSLIDTLMVSRLGDLALSSVGMAGQWSWFLNLITFGVASGMSVFGSQYRGVKNHAAMRRVLGLSLLIILCVSAVFTVSAAVFPTAIISIFNKTPAVIESGTAYLKIACISYPAVGLTVILSTFLRTIEQPRVPMYVSLFTTALNAFLNYTLIFGHFGAPALGVRGAAVATCISSWTGPVLLLAISLVQHNHMVRHPRDLVSFTRQDAAAFVRRAFPVVLNETVWALGTLALQSIYSNMGYEYYAAVSIVKTFMELSFAFIVGLGNACVIMVGKSVGAGRIEQCLRDAKRFSLLVPLGTAVIGLMMILLRRPLISIFTFGDNISDLTIQTALFITLFVAIELPLRNIPYIQIVGIYRSGGDTLYGMLCDVGTLWVFAVPVAFLAANVWHLPFVWVYMLAYLTEDVPKVVICLQRFFSKKWLKPVTPEGIAGLAQWRRQHEKHKIQEGT